MKDKEWLLAASLDLPDLVQYEIYAIFKEHAAQRCRLDDWRNAQLRMRQKNQNQNARTSKDWPVTRMDDYPTIMVDWPPDSLELSQTRL